MMDFNWQEVVMAVGILIGAIGGLFGWKGGRKVEKFLRDAAAPKEPEEK